MWDPFRVVPTVSSAGEQGTNACRDHLISDVFYASFREAFAGAVKCAVFQVGICFLCECLMLLLSCVVPECGHSYDSFGVTSRALQLCRYNQYVWFVFCSCFRVWRGLCVRRSTGEYPSFTGVATGMVCSCGTYSHAHKMYELVLVPKLPNGIVLCTFDSTHADCCSCHASKNCE